MPLARLLNEQKDCLMLVFSNLTRRQALLASQSCKQARIVVLEMLQREPCPFRQAVVIACSQPGRLLEFDVIQFPRVTATTTPDRSMMWNAAPSPYPAPKHTKRRRRSYVTLPSRKQTRKRAPWMTGLTVGPPSWERVRKEAVAQQAAAAAAVPSVPTWHDPSPTNAWGEEDIVMEETAVGVATDAAAGAAGTAAAGVAAGAAGGSSSGSMAPAFGDSCRNLRFWPQGLTLFACCYSVTGIVAFDGTTLLPLGVLASFEDDPDLANPEGLCASNDSLFVLGADDCTVARVGLERHDGARRVWSRDPPEVRAYGGYLSYGRGVILSKIAACRGWVGWGMTLSPDGGSLFCAVDRPYETRGQQYTCAPPPVTSGSVLCVPVGLLTPGSNEARPASHSPAAATSTAIAPYHYVRGDAVLRRPSGLRVSPDGMSLWVTSYDEGLVELAGPAADEAAGTVLRVVPLPPQAPPPSRKPQHPPGCSRDGPTSGSAAAVGLRQRARSGNAGAESAGQQAAGSSGAGGSITGACDRTGGGVPKRMLAWDVCWVPQVPPAWLGISEGGSNGMIGGAVAAATAGIAGLSRSPVDCCHSPAPAGPSGAAASSTRTPGPSGSLPAAMPPRTPLGLLASAASTNSPTSVLGWVAGAPFPSPQTTYEGSPCGGGTTSATITAGVASISPPSPPLLLCVTLHEDPAKRLKDASGAECRVGVVRQGPAPAAALAGADVSAVQGGPGSSRGAPGWVGAEDEADEAVVEVVGRWRSTIDHTHPSMVCVC